ncbi:succinyl-CoA synthetase subunit alpha [Candidatus Woesearchaeota archaeon]|nr:succinyl-CoA synthetase subunit alpha [Candidatus Woesearchaeota archaeon]
MEKEINYNSFLRLNVKNYSNKWIAIVDGKVVSSGNTFREAYNQSKTKFPKNRPLIAKIPSKKVMIL